MRGLTTGAGMWAAAGIDLAAGPGLWAMAALTAGLAPVIDRGPKRLEDRVG